MNVAHINIAPEEVSFASSSTGYMIFYRGKPVGGLGSLAAPARHHCKARLDFDSRVWFDAAKHQANLIAIGVISPSIKDAILRIAAPFPNKGR